MSDALTSKELSRLAWLVERQEDGRAVWYTPNFQWTTDANEALWFVRQLDAELFCFNTEIEASAVEHMFCSAPEARSCDACGDQATDACPHCQATTCGKCSVCEHGPALEPAAVPSTNETLWCQDCGGQTTRDHNSYQCNRCKKLWPLPRPSHAQLASQASMAGSVRVASSRAIDHVDATDGCEAVSPAAPSLHQASAISALELVDRLLAQAGYADDASVRHNLAIGLSCIRASQPPEALRVGESVKWRGNPEAMTVDALAYVCKTQAGNRIMFGAAELERATSTKGAG